jgi:hypothetical protein
MITGFYGGYLNALSQISGVEEANNRIAARNQQMQLAAKQDYLGRPDSPDSFYRLQHSAAKQHGHQPVRPGRSDCESVPECWQIGHGY